MPMPDNGDMQTAGNAALLNSAKIFVHAGGLEDYGISSPIECIMAVGLRGLRLKGMADDQPVIVPYREFDAGLEECKSRDVPLIIPQFAVASRYYILDFAVMIPGTADRPHRLFAIECDGHDWHQDSREQIVNDRIRERALMEDGWIVVRFAGSEIYKDPTECVLSFQRIANQWISA